MIVAKLFAVIAVLVGLLGIWLEHQSIAIKQGTIQNRSQ